ncbi:unnamed protein product [Heterobilharzia americana]|nr:unnamed protein product [Heterobilharzia americana]
MYPEWLEPSVPVYAQFYFFNLTNPIEFQAGQKPCVQQLGPYTYREKRMKINISIDNELISYREIRQYYFDANLSNGTEMDLITGVNLAFISIAAKMNSVPWFIDRIVEQIEKYFHDGLILTKTVNELLWGYEDEFLKALSKIGLAIPTTHIGLLMNINNTVSDYVTVDNGRINSSMVGQIVKFHGNETLSYWTTPTANMINGSDGTIFHPFIKKEDKPYIFSADICRSLQFIANLTTQINNLPVIKFIPMPDTFKSPKTYEKNKGFCLNWPDCFDDGVLDMSSCQPGSAVVMSQPHFLNANESYQNAVEGIHPNDEFNTVIYLEPNTGSIVKAEKKIQVNILVKNVKTFKQLSNIQTVILPIMFVNESVQLNDTLVDQLVHALIKTPYITKIILVCIVTLSIPVMCFGLSVYFFQTARNSVYIHFEDEQQQHPSEDDSQQNVHSEDVEEHKHQQQLHQQNPVA